MVATTDQLSLVAATRGADVNDPDQIVCGPWSGHCGPQAVLATQLAK